MGSRVLKLTRQSDNAKRLSQGMVKILRKEKCQPHIGQTRLSGVLAKPSRLQRNGRKDRNMGLKLSAGLGLALLVLSGAFKLYYDKSQSEIKAFHLQLEQSIQNQKTLEGTIEQQNENLRQTVENQELMVAQVEKLTKENMMAQNEVTDIRKKFSRHSMDALSVRKPKLIENIINRGTKSVLNDLKVITNESQFDKNINISSSVSS